MALITGEAGIGKTTLVDVFHKRAAFRPNLRIARGQCVEGFGGKEAYYPVLEALGQLIRDGEGSSVIQMLAKHAPTWLIQFYALVKAEQREALRRETLGTTRERMVREICEALEHAHVRMACRDGAYLEVRVREKVVRVLRIPGEKAGDAQRIAVLDTGTSGLAARRSSRR